MLRPMLNFSLHSQARRELFCQWYSEHFYPSVMTVTRAVDKYYLPWLEQRATFPCDLSFATSHSDLLQRLDTLKEWIASEKTPTNILEERSRRLAAALLACLSEYERVLGGLLAASGYTAEDEESVLLEVFRFELVPGADGHLALVPLLLRAADAGEGIDGRKLRELLPVSLYELLPTLELQVQREHSDVVRALERSPLDALLGCLAACVPTQPVDSPRQLRLTPRQAEPYKRRARLSSLTSRSRSSSAPRAELLLGGADKPHKLPPTSPPTSPSVPKMRSVAPAA